MDRILVLGGGESGAGAALLAKQKGYEVLVSDAGRLRDEQRAFFAQHGIEAEEGSHARAYEWLGEAYKWNRMIERAKIVGEALPKLPTIEVVKSPGIPPWAEEVEKAINCGVNIRSELEFAQRFTTAPLVCVTGTNGKTTTASLIHDMMLRGGIRAGLCGNVGKSFAMMVAEDPQDAYVLEVSSFQLDDSHELHAHVAVLLNITPDHLDRYDHKLYKYALSKFRILQNMDENDYFIYCADDSMTAQFAKVFVTAAHSIPFSLKTNIIDNKLTMEHNNEQVTVPLEELSLRGQHNQYNSMAAALAGMVMNIRKSAIREGLQRFQSIEHRLEKVMSVRGIEFVNDSKATNVNSTWYALDSMDAPVVWIAGGTDKGNDYSVLADLVRQKVKAIVCLGKDNAKIKEYFSPMVDIIVEAGSAEEAVQAAYKLGGTGDVVLLSPACASFDLFKNYEDRGRQFKEAVRRL